MPDRSRTVRRQPSLPALALALAPAALGAQVPTASPASADSTLRSAGLAGSVAAQLNAFVGRYDASTTAYGVGLAALPFLTDHVQLGVITGYNGSKTTGYDALHASSAALAGNYVLGGGPRWRVYAGGYAGGRDVSEAGRRSVAGLQVGALYFLDPAVAIQAEYEYGRALDDNGPAFGRVSVGLQPFLFGRAGYAAPAPAGLGMADVAFSAFAFGRDGGTRGARALFAPYLTRWLQVGGTAEIDRSGYAYATTAGYFRAALTEWSGTGFARAYLPVSARVQPFAGGFVGHGTTASAESRVGATSYGPALGLRYFLNARVALDGALQRTFYGTYSGAGAGAAFRPPAQTGFTVGLATRFGQTP